MTDREKEIRDAERKALAEVRRWRRNVAKKRAAMTPEEREEHHRKYVEKMKAEGWIETENGLLNPRFLSRAEGYNITDSAR